MRIKFSITLYYALLFLVALFFMHPTSDSDAVIKLLILFTLYFITSNRVITNVLTIFCDKAIYFYSVLLVTYFIFLAVWYSFSYVFFDHVEPNIAIVSYIFQKGSLVYHNINAPELYSLQYGPMLYIINGFFINLFGPSIFSSKVSGVTAAVLGLLFLFLLLRNNLGNKFSLKYMGYIILCYLIFGNYTFWNRPDSYILFLVSLGLFSVVNGNRLIATIVCGLALGIIVGLKIFAPLYLMPIFSLLYLRFGIRWLATSLLIAIPIAFSPFIIYKNISFQNYIFNLSIAVKHGIKNAACFKSIKFAFFYILVPNIIWLSFFHMKLR